jgi:two-component system sensor histidine kinase HydH
MHLTKSMLVRSASRGGPLVVALLMGVLLVVSSALSYRDSRVSAAAVAEREGIRFLTRLALQLGHHAPTPAAVQSAFEANRPLGLMYLRVGTAEAGQALLGNSRPTIGAPGFGHGRVRMAFPSLPPPSNARILSPPDRERAPGDDAPLLLPDVAIEFEPVLSADTTRRALSALILAASAAALLALSALILWVKARRADRDELSRIAQQHLAQIGEMSAILAHEIRNPLASLKGHAQLLEEKVADSPLADRVGRIVTEAIRLEHLTTDLLDFSRAKAASLAEADPAAPLAKACAATVPERITMSSHGAPSRWLLDVCRIEQVLTNLIENALAVTPDGRTVEVRVGCEGDVLVYSIRDHGPGVPAAERARIFEPFHTTKLHGTGLGLAVVKRIVDLHRGKIEVLDAPGGGADFRVLLPKR